MIDIEDLTDAQKDDLLIQLLDREMKTIATTQQIDRSKPSILSRVLSERERIVDELRSVVRARQELENSKLYQDLLFRRDEDSKDADDE